MDYDTYATPEPVDEFLRDVNVKSSIPFFREMLSPSGSEREDARDMAASFASMQRQEQRKGGPISRRSSGYAQIDTYQRNGIARLSRAVRQSQTIKVTKRSQIQAKSKPNHGLR